MAAAANHIPRGFTLLELLVALAIASIMLGIVTLNLMPTAQSKLRDESKRLAFLMENGALASQAGGQPLAWSGTGNSYRFWKRTKEGEWVRIEQDKLLRPRTLPEAVFIDTVTFDGRRIEPGALVMLSPELAARTFRIDLKSGGHFATVNGDGLGKIHVEEGQLP